MFREFHKTAAAQVVAGGLVWVMLAGVTLLAQARSVVSTSGAPAVPRPGALPASNSDHRDAIILLDSGPLHLRLHVGLGGVSLAEARRKYVASLIERVDADHDGKLTRAEAQKSPLLK